MQSLIAHINNYIPLDAEAQKLIEDHLEIRNLGKKELLLAEGTVCKANHFILKGCFRMYFIKENGHEQTIQFALENWWITDYTSLETGKPSSYYIQSIEPSTIAILTKRNQEILFERLPQLESYFRRILQRAFSATTARFQFLYDQNAEERYHHFYNAYPAFVQRIPQYMLASYLGFTPEVLSKIRGKK